MNSDSSPRRGPTWPSPDPGITRRNSRVSCVGVSGSKSRPPPGTQCALGLRPEGQRLRTGMGCLFQGCMW